MGIVIKKMINYYNAINVNNNIIAIENVNYKHGHLIKVIASHPNHPSYPIASHPNHPIQS